MPANDGAITSKNVRKSAKEVLEDDNQPAVNEKDSPIETLAQMVQEEKQHVSKEEADRILTDAESKYLLRMERKNASWQTRNGVIFSQEHPYQLVDESELDELLDEGGFRRADPREVVKYYQDK